MKGRSLVQVLTTLWVNAYWGFLSQGGLYRGVFKNLCFPGLNCYSCPLAIMACPLGVLQHVLATLRTLPLVAFKAALYVIGSLLLYGLLLGRFVCGWLCPFGLLQELLYRLPGKKISFSRRWRFIKVGLFFLLVVTLPFLWKGETGYGEVWFCKIFCPAGTLEAGLPHLLLEPSLRSLVGLLFYWKLFLLGIFIAGSILYLRFFCKLFCPLGWIYGHFNRLGLLRLRWEEASCIRCGLCEEVCPMELKIPRELNSGECIRCLNCMNGCPTKSIRLQRSFRWETELDRLPLSVTEMGYEARRSATGRNSSGKNRS